MLDKLSPELISSHVSTPEWLRQRYLISKGQKTWDDFSFEERACKGFLLPYLVEIESRFAGRWDYWLRTLFKGDLLNEPIPQIDFCHGGDPNAKKNLITCLRQFSNHGVRLTDFLDWVCWGLGEGEDRPRVDAKVNEFWYKTFNLGLLIQQPYDYFGDILTETKAGWNNPNAFFPTPHEVCEMMVMINFPDGQDYRAKSVSDPCVGTGRMLMHASNHSLFLYGQDVDYVCVRACLINSYLYMPWVVRPGLPKPAVGDEGKTKPAFKAKKNNDVASNVKLMPDPNKTKRPSKPHQLELF